MFAEKNLILKLNVSKDSFPLEYEFDSKQWKNSTTYQIHWKFRIFESKIDSSCLNFSN